MYKNIIYSFAYFQTSSVARYGRGLAGRPTFECVYTQAAADKTYKGRRLSTGRKPDFTDSYLLLVVVVVLLLLLSFLLLLHSFK